MYIGPWDCFQKKVFVLPPYMPTRRRVNIKSILYILYIYIYIYIYIYKVCNIQSELHSCMVDPASSESYFPVMCRLYDSDSRLVAKQSQGQQRVHTRTSDHVTVWLRDYIVGSSIYNGVCCIDKATTRDTMCTFLLVVKQQTDGRPPTCTSGYSRLSSKTSRST